MQTEGSKRARRHPDWIKVRLPAGDGFRGTQAIVKAGKLHTVCEEARCPNLGECWAHKTATFMLMGDHCTRNCAFCAVTHGRAKPLDADEPRRVAQAVAALALRHVVLTSVNRDDLEDGGAGHFVATVAAIKDRLPGCRVEVLVPDFQGDEASVSAVATSRIDVFNHNTETVPRLYRRARAGARYERSLDVLRQAKGARPELVTKSGLMLGLGETAPEVETVLRDLRRADCDVLTLGQYLRPSTEHLPVERYLTPSEFEGWGRRARSLGFRHVESGPLVRSSYHAWSHIPR